MKNSYIIIATRRSLNSVEILNKSDQNLITSKIFHWQFFGKDNFILANSLKPNTTQHKLKKSTSYETLGVNKLTIAAPIYWKAMHCNDIFVARRYKKALRNVHCLIICYVLTISAFVFLNHCAADFVP